MRTFIAVVTALVVVACVDEPANNDPKVCADLPACFANGTWNTKIESFENGRLTPVSGSRGIIAFDKNMTGTTTDLFFAGYADGQYYTGFTYEVDAAKSELTITYSISQTHPAQSMAYTITSAYKNKIEMEKPTANGKLIILLSQ
jgi:hypothetical protein